MDVGHNKRGEVALRLFTFLERQSRTVQLFAALTVLSSTAPFHVLCSDRFLHPPPGWRNKEAGRIHPSEIVGALIESLSIEAPLPKS